MSTPYEDIRLLYKGLLDIDNITLPEQWFSLAFNRMLHDKFAPKYMWEALIQYSSKWPDNSECYIGEENFFMSHDIKEMDRINLSEISIVSYLIHDFRFTKNHVLIGLFGRWAIRLDQDVIYFLFHVDDKDYILELLGGFAEIENIMLEEFDGVKGKAGTVEKYVSALLQNLDH